MPAEPACPVALLWKLPLEVREEIYYYAVSQPPEKNTPVNQIRNVGAVRLFEGWWGTEPMSRILRVNRQIHDEAEAVLYSQYKFCFPNYTDTDLVHRVLDPMSVRARHLLGRIELFYIVRTHTIPRPGYPAPTSERIEHQWKDAFSLLVELLPGLREAEIGIGFVGGDMPEDQRREVVEVALRIASPLKYVEKLGVHPAGKYEGQRSETFRDIAERVRNRSW